MDDGFPGARSSCRSGADRCAAFPAVEVALVWGRHFDPAVPAKFDLAIASQFHFAGFSRLYSRARCSHWADQGIFAGPVEADAAGTSAVGGGLALLRGVRAGKALSRAGLDVHRAAIA